MSVRRRIVSGTLANSAGIGMNALLQLLSVPVLASAWGVEAFGIWMMLTTIPTYFALTDLGFVQAATSDMTMQVANGQKGRALAIFQSTSLLLLLICAAVLCLAVAGAAAGKFWLGGPFFDYADLFVLLCLFAALSLLSRLPLAGLRATGHYAVGTLSYDLLVLAEGLAGLLTAFLGGHFIEVALCLIGMRLINGLALYALLRRKVAWLHCGFAHASKAELSRLLQPAIAAMAIPVALAINLQGVVLIVGAVLSPTAVAVYTAVRTCSRLLVQVIGVVNRASMPEIARAIALSDGGGFVKLLKINSLMIGGLLLPGTVIFAFLGREFIMVWSAGQIAAPRSFILLMAIATALHGAWYFVSNMLLAANLHISLAKFVLGASLATLALTLVLCRAIGLEGAAIALIAGEVLCAVAVARAFFSSYRQLT